MGQYYQAVGDPCSTHGPVPQTHEWPMIKDTVEGSLFLFFCNESRLRARVTPLFLCNLKLSCFFVFAISIRNGKDGYAAPNA